MFVPYFLFSNVKFNGTVLPFEYQEILAPRIKGYPESHMLTQKDPRQINHPGPFLQNAPKQIPYLCNLYFSYSFSIYINI